MTERQKQSNEKKHRRRMGRVRDGSISFSIEKDSEAAFYDIAYARGLSGAEQARQLVYQFLRDHKEQTYAEQ